MMKNFLLLGLLSWVSFSYAAHPIVQENIAESSKYKVEKPAEESEKARSIAGGKAKKKEMKEEHFSESDSEVQYWQYSE